MRRSVWRWLCILALFALLIPLSAVPSAAGPASAPTASDGAVSAVSASDAGMAKVHPKLRARLATAAADEEFHIILRVKNGVDITRYLREPLIRPFSDDGFTTVYGYVKAGVLPKLANNPAVNVILPFEPVVEPPLYRDPDAPAKPLGREAVQAKLAEIAAGKTKAKPEGSGVGAAGWHDILDNHKSKAAWEKGFTGEGIRVAVVDSGIDFAHPDLMGTWAVQPFGDYEGWPIMIDTYSLLLKAYDYYLGYDYVASGMTWYVDTTKTITEEDPTYQPIGASEPHTYTLTGTSLSGVYRIGSHPDDSLRQWWWGERVAVLLVDEHEPGVYDTVYVDLDDDYDFTNEKPCTKEDPVSYRDLDGDGFADVSGGLVYWIADGEHTVPFGWLWGFEPDPAGSLVAFFLNDPTHSGAGDHGTLCASAVAGQGVIDGGAPPYKPAGDGTPFTGMVVGGGRDVALVGAGDFYTYGDSTYDMYLCMVYGLDGRVRTGDEVHIASNSWGNSATDNDGWDYESRMMSTRQRLYNPTMSVLVATGNGAPGYGTITSPEDDSFIGVGASTQMGSTGWDSATTMDQITYGDVTPWSGRGPTAQGNVGVKVVASGAYASGDIPLNEWGEGWTAWETWGGTSRATPVAAGNLALVYDAFLKAHGRLPTWAEARAIFMSGATTTDNDVVIQGAGRVNADRATDLAGGLYGVFATPDNWTVGDYRGDIFPGFAKVVFPGKTYTGEFTLTNPGTADVHATVSSDTLVKIGEMSFEWTSSPMGQEDAYNFNRPNYLLRDLSADVPEGTDLMIIRMAMPWDEFDPEGDYNAQTNQIWRMVIYDWTDVNGDGNLWTDLNGNGTVNCPGGWGSAGCEVDGGEYMRFAYLHSASPTEMVTIHKPLERMHDGIWLGLQHSRRNASVPVTHLKFRVEFYRHMPWDVLGLGEEGAPEIEVHVPAGGEAAFTATVRIPADMPVGFYEGAILVSDPGDGAHEPHVTTIPVVFNVAAPSPNFVFGGPPASVHPYDNGRIFGAMDQGWRAETGDWRFYFFDVPDDLPAGTNFLVDTRWDNVPTDVDTIVLGPAPDQFTSDPEDRWYQPDYYGPYTLDYTGRSTNTNIGAGTWVFNTATGAQHEIVSAEGRAGLNAVLLHTVIFAGKDVSEVIAGQVGTIRAQPSPIEIFTTQATGSLPIEVVSSLNLADLSVDGFGLSVPEVLTEQPISQDNPDDPCSASFTHDLTIEHGALLDVWTENTAHGSDIDLYVYYDANHDGVFECPGERVGSSTTPTDQERVTINFPPDGAYRIQVHGWGISGASDVFDMTVNAVQGRDLSVPAAPVGPFPAHTPISFNLAWNVPSIEPGMEAYGMVLLGPSVAPGAVAIPVTFKTPQTSMAVMPASAQFRVSETQSVDLEVTGAENLYAAEAHLTFDPRVVHVKSITQGDLLPAGSSTALLNFDNSLGKIDIAITLLAPAAPVNGDGTLVTIEFEGVGVGTSEVAFTGATFSDAEGHAQPVWLHDGAFTVLTNLGTVAGRITLQGRSDARGVVLTIDGITATVTDPAGNFVITDVPMGTRTLTASFDGYLDAAVQVNVLPEQQVTVPTGKLRGGDVNNDGIINAQDLAIVGSAFGTTPPSDPRADLNGDGTVNIFDLVLVGANFGATSPTPWQ